MLNKFQKWANDYARAYGFTVTPKGNWVEITKNGKTIEVMSAQGLQDAINSVEFPAFKFGAPNA